MRRFAIAFLVIVASAPTASAASAVAERPFAGSALRRQYTPPVRILMIPERPAEAAAEVEAGRRSPADAGTADASDGSTE